MRRLLRPRFTIPIAIVAIATLAFGGLMVYAGAQKDTVAKGVSVGGIDIGGLKEQAAVAKLRRVLLRQLQQPIVIQHGHHLYTLKPGVSEISANLQQSVNAALQRSHKGSALSRAMRSLTGGKITADITPQIAYNHKAVVKLLDHIREDINRRARSASAGFDADGLYHQSAHTGLKLKTHELHQQILAALVNPAAPHRFLARTTHVKPKVTGKTLSKEYSTALFVNRSKFTLTLYKNFKVAKRYTVSIGVQGLETPAGLYHIQNKAVNPGWQVPNSAWAGSLAGTYVPPGPADPIKARWLGIIDGAGIHGVDPSEYGSIGHAGSHGCVRMTIPDVIDLYPRVPVGTPIYIE